MLKKNTVIIAFFSLLLSCIAVYAQPIKQYQITCIIFSHLTHRALGMEHWPIYPPQTDITAIPTSNVFSPINQQALTLKREAAHIAQSSDYQVLYHKAWDVAANNLNHTQTIGIYAAKKEPNDAILVGTISVSLKHFFNINTHLTLIIPTEELQLKSNNPVFEQAHNTFLFVLHQKRRMRSDELNYIAHPLFGMLIKIMPTPLIKKPS